MVVYSTKGTKPSAVRDNEWLLPHGRGPWWRSFLLSTDGPESDGFCSWTSINFCCSPYIFDPCLSSEQIRAHWNNRQCISASHHTGGIRYKGPGVEGHLFHSCVFWGPADGNNAQKLWFGVKQGPGSVCAADTICGQVPGLELMWPRSPK